MTLHSFHMQQIWMPRLLTWQESMLASISPIAPRENWPLLATFIAIASTIACNAAMVSAPDNPWMTSKSLVMSLWNVAVECISVTALFRTGEAMITGAWLKHIRYKSLPTEEKTRVSSQTTQTDLSSSDLATASCAIITTASSCEELRSRPLIFKSWVIWTETFCNTSNNQTILWRGLCVKLGSSKASASIAFNWTLFLVTESITCHWGVGISSSKLCTLLHYAFSLHAYWCFWYY